MILLNRYARYLYGIWGGVNGKQSRIIEPNSLSVPDTVRHRMPWRSDALSTDVILMNLL